MNVQDVTNVLETIAPLRYAAEWDNVGLLIGSPRWRADHVLLTIDLTEEVLAEAADNGVKMVVAYHPPIFEPLNTLTDATVRQAIVLEAARAGIAVYTPHTALDAAPGGVTDWLARGLGSGDARALEPYESLPQSEQCKIVTFCPAEAVDPIRAGLATVGAGRIGNYQLCSFELRGTGTFFGDETTNPAVGERDALQRVDEVRLEMVCGKNNLALAVMTLREFHPYEEPAIEVYQLLPRPNRRVGHGGRVVLDQRVDIETLVERVKACLGVNRIGIAPGRDAPEAYQIIGLCPGAGGSFLDAAIEQGCELFFTGEMRHHDVLAAQARGCTIMLAGHTNTERGYLPLLRDRMAQALPGCTISVAQADINPLRFM
jgi:dinuclear metal center YbgI/SA1388 family protein